MMGYRAWRGAALFLAAVLCTWGCDEDGSDGGGGAGGTAGGGGGAGGDPCDADPTCCPQAFPVHGASCNKTVSCPYSFGASCPTPANVEATCEGGTWHALHLTGCTPLDPGASCDPVGTWQVDYQGGAGADQPLMPSGFELVIATDADGHLFMSAQGTIDPIDGCTIMAQWTEYWADDVGGSIDVEDQLDLTVSGDQATGTYATSCEGDCGWSETYPATATRISS